MPDQKQEIHFTEELWKYTMLKSKISYDPLTTIALVYIDSNELTAVYMIGTIFNLFHTSRLFLYSLKT